MCVEQRRMLRRAYLGCDRYSSCHVHFDGGAKLLGKNSCDLQLLQSLFCASATNCKAAPTRRPYLVHPVLRKPGLASWFVYCRGRTTNWKLHFRKQYAGDFFVWACYDSTTTKHYDKNVVGLQYHYTVRHRDRVSDIVTEWRPDIVAEWERSLAICRIYKTSSFLHYKKG